MNEAILILIVLILFVFLYLVIRGVGRFFTDQKAERGKKGSDSFRNKHVRIGK